MVTTETHEEAVSSYLNEAYRADSAELAAAELKVSLEVVTDYMGSAGALLHVKDKLTVRYLSHSCMRDAWLTVLRS